MRLAHSCQGLAFGSGAAFNGSTLAASKEVVVVSINYRLGVLGFTAFAEDLSGARSSGTGNWGLQDQQSALRWVQRHAHVFGGDKSRVMIFGQSAGASSVHKHLVMPSSRGLFASALMESGSTHSWPLSFSLAKTAKLAAHFNCSSPPASPSSPSSSTSSLKTCLRAQSVAGLLAYQGDSPIPAVNDEQALPTDDGVLFPRSPLALTRDGLMADVPLLLGSNTNDSTLFVQGYPLFTTMNTSTEYMHILNRTLSVDGHAAIPAGSTAAATLARLKAIYPPREDAEENAHQFALYQTDAGFACPTRAVARGAAAAADAGRRRSPVFMYRYNHPWAQRSCYDLFFDASFGTTHTAEVSYVFGRPIYLFGPPSPCATNGSCALDPTERNFSDVISTLWTSFAAGGPPRAQGWTWPAFTSARGNNVVLDASNTPHVPTQRGARGGAAAAAAAAAAVAGKTGEAGKDLFEEEFFLRKLQCDYWDKQNP